MRRPLLQLHYATPKKHTQDSNRPLRTFIGVAYLVVFGVLIIAGATLLLMGFQGGWFVMAPSIAVLIARGWAFDESKD